MIELTKEQIEAAAKAGWNANGNHWPPSDEQTKRESIMAYTAAAPYLQSPWEMPTEEEVESLFKLLDIPSISGRREYAHRLLRSFIERRNAKLLPKPVDPRREKIEGVLIKKLSTPQDYADAIIAALDEGTDGS